MIKSTAFLLLLLPNTAAFLQTKSVHVKGIISCNGTKVSKATLKLVDNSFLTGEKILNKKETDYNGNFDIMGTGRVIFSLDPKLKIYNNCGDNNTRCKKVVIIPITNEAVSTGTLPQLTDMGAIDLSFPYPNVLTDCNP